MLHSLHGQLLQFTTPVHGLARTWMWRNRDIPTFELSHFLAKYCIYGTLYEMVKYGRSVIKSNKDFIAPDRI